MALAIIRAQPRFASNPYVFSGRGGEGPFNGFSPGKRRLDKKLPPDMPGWVLHDLRRTSRSLMARAGIADRVAEQVLGHVIGGIEGTYNRHRYDDEKADALRRLAALLDRILHPQENVVPLRSSVTPTTMNARQDPTSSPRRAANDDSTMATRGLK